MVSSVLERVGDKGSVTHIYQTGQPQTNCLAAMDYPKKAMNCLDVINIQHLRSLEQGLDILAKPTIRGQRLRSRGSLRKRSWPPRPVWKPVMAGQAISR